MRALENSKRMKNSLGEMINAGGSNSKGFSKANTMLSNSAAFAASGTSSKQPQTIFQI
jgi:hypothetical protein